MLPKSCLVSSSNNSSNNQPSHVNGETITSVNNLTTVATIYVTSISLDSKNTQGLNSREGIHVSINRIPAEGNLTAFSLQRYQLDSAWLLQLHVPWLQDVKNDTSSINIVAQYCNVSS